MGANKKAPVCTDALVVEHFEKVHPSSLKKWSTLEFNLKLLDWVQKRRRTSKEVI